MDRVKYRDGTWDDYDMIFVMPTYIICCKEREKKILWSSDYVAVKTVPWDLVTAVEKI